MSKTLVISQSKTKLSSNNEESHYPKIKTMKITKVEINKVTTILFNQGEKKGRRQK